MSEFPAREVRSIFLKYGVHAPLRAEPLGPTEEIFLLDRDQLASLDERKLVRELTGVLPDTKIGLAVNGPLWRSEPV
jgi:hypothetical protein